MLSTEVIEYRLKKLFEMCDFIEVPLGDISKFKQAIDDAIILMDKDKVEEEREITNFDFLLKTQRDFVIKNVALQMCLDSESNTVTKCRCRCDGCGFFEEGDDGTKCTDNAIHWLNEVHKGDIQDD